LPGKSEPKIVSLKWWAMMVMNGFISWYLILEKSPQKQIQAKGYSPQSVTWNLKMMENSQKKGGFLAIN